MRPVQDKGVLSSAADVGGALGADCPRVGRGGGNAEQVIERLSARAPDRRAGYDAPAGSVPVLDERVRWPRWDEVAALADRPYVGRRDGTDRFQSSVGMGREGF